MAKKTIKKTKVVKDNLKTFNEEITNFNKRLRIANRKKLIDKNTYKMLMLDKEKKDFYRSTIYTKRQFNKFLNDLKKANIETLKESKKKFSKIGENLNELAKTRYEKKILQDALNYANKNDNKFYKDLIFNINQKNYTKAFNRLQKITYETQNKNKIFKENFLNAYKSRFGNKTSYNKNIDKVLNFLNVKQIKQIAKVPKLINTMLYPEEYDPFTSEEDLKKYIDEIIKTTSNNVNNDDIDFDNITLEELY